jgi:carbonic anhydrase
MKRYKSHYLILCFILLSFVSLAQTETELAIQKLIEGNKRFASSQPNHPNSDLGRISEVAKGQDPFAVVVSCSDSRVPPEIIFDQGLGDLFVIRTAGEVIDDIALASIEYAVEHLDVNLIVVLGHQKCGAVDAAVKGGELPPHLDKLVNTIKPAVEKAKEREGDLLDNSVHENIRRVVSELSLSKPILEEFVHEHKLTVVGAYYDLEKGTVEFLE